MRSGTHVAAGILISALVLGDHEDRSQGKMKPLYRVCAEGSFKVEAVTLFYD